MHNNFSIHLLSVFIFISDEKYKYKYEYANIQSIRKPLSAPVVTELPTLISTRWDASLVLAVGSPALLLDGCFPHSLLVLELFFLCSKKKRVDKGV